MRPELLAQLKREGYSDFKQLEGHGTCALLKFAFTTGIVCTIDEYGYSGRYCYEHEADARAALQAWDGTGHPTGPWIKAKGWGVDLLNPELTA